MLEILKKKNIDNLFWAELGLAVFVSIGSLLIHITFLMHAGALWRDEVSCVNISQLPSLEKMWTAMQFDSPPPLLFFILRGWTGLGFGDSDIRLRTLGVIIGISLIGILWRNAWKMGYKIPLVSLVLIGLCPTFFIYGNTLRPYGIGVLLMIWMVYSIWEVVQTPVWNKTLKAGIASILAVNCVYYNWLIIFSVYFGALAVIVRNRSFKTIGALIIIGILTLASLSMHFIRLPQLMEMTRIWKKGTNMEQIINKYVEAVSASGSLMIWVWFFLFIFTLIYFTYYLFRDVKQKKHEKNDLMLFMGISTGVSVVCYLLFLANLSYNMESWYFMTIMGFLAISFEIALYGAFKDKKIARVIKFALTGIIAVWMFVIVWPQAQTRMTNIDLLSTKLEYSADKNDLIIVDNCWPSITFARYYSGKTPWMTIPEINDNRFYRMDLFENKMMEQRPLQNIINNIAMTLRSGNKVWMVGQFNYLKKGEVPGSLPSPPLIKSGWYSGPYHYIWSRQLSYFIQSNAKIIKEITIPVSGPVSKYEKLPLFLIKG